MRVGGVLLEQDVYLKDAPGGYAPWRMRTVANTGWMYPQVEELCQLFRTASGGSELRCKRHKGKVAYRYGWGCLFYLPQGVSEDVLRKFLADVVERSVGIPAGDVRTEDEVERFVEHVKGLIASLGDTKFIEAEGAIHNWTTRVLELVPDAGKYRLFHLMSGSGPDSTVSGQIEEITHFDLEGKYSVLRFVQEVLLPLTYAS